MNNELSNKVVVVTGSSRGIGRELIIKLALEGASVVINYKDNYEKALKLFRYVNNFNKKCLLVQADVSKEDEVKRLYKETIEKFNSVDVLINNAGICSDNYIQFMSLEQWDEVINTNLRSVFLCSRIFSKAMIKRRHGKIINVSSIKGLLGSEGQCNYSASKAGVVGLTKSLAKELGAFNISVNAICPGFIVTDLNRESSNKARIAQEMSVLNVNNSLNDLLNFVVYMSSEKLKGVSGQVFSLDSRIL